MSLRTDPLSRYESYKIGSKRQHPMLLRRFGLNFPDTRVGREQAGFSLSPRCLKFGKSHRFRRRSLGKYPDATEGKGKVR